MNSPHRPDRSSCRRSSSNHLKAPHPSEAEVAATLGQFQLGLVSLPLGSDIPPQEVAQLSFSSVANTDVIILDRTKEISLGPTIH